MSDVENTDTKKRGRVAAGDKRSITKKDEKQTVADGETVAKRGRGRPKGTTKKNGSVKKAAIKKGSAPTTASSKGRGRPAKKKADSTEEENEENDDTEGNDDENESGSD